jgi:hypothetical protein
MTIPTLSHLLSLSPKKTIPRRREKRVCDFIRNEVSGIPIVLIDNIQSTALTEVSMELSTKIFLYFPRLLKSALCEGTAITTTMEQRKAPKNQMNMVVAPSIVLSAALPKA